MTDLSATSGLNIAQNTLNAIASNVANVSTPGYKSGVYSFLATLAASADSVLSDPGSGIIQQFTQGNITSTGNPLNAAINGQGFFQVAGSNGQVGYTRNGEFAIGSDNALKSVNGSNVMGYASDGKGNILPALTTLSLNKNPLPPSATKTVSMNVNLAGLQAAPTTSPFNAADPTSYTNSQTVAVYDPSGVSHSLQTYFAQSSVPGTYNLYFTLDRKNVTPAGAAPPVLMKFNADGTQAGMGNPTSIALALPANGTTFSTSVNVSQLTRFGTAYQEVSVAQDGYATGNFSGFSIGQDGKISTSYSNGQSAVAGQIALANFVNPEGLTPTNGGTFLESAASGQPTVGKPGTGALGVLQTSSLESANVDIAAAMVDMITAQRNYQANAQAVKINDQIMQTLVSLR